MTSGIKTIIYPVADLAKAKALYGALLGVEPSVDQPYYVGYRTTGIDIGLDPNGHSKGMTGPLAYWHVTDIAQSIQTLIDNGAATLQAVTDVGGGKLIASLQDPDGNPIGLIQEP